VLLGLEFVRRRERAAQHVGVDRARVDGVGADSLVRVRDGDGFHHADERVLGGVVHRVAGAAHQAAAAEAVKVVTRAHKTLIWETHPPQASFVRLLEEFGLDSIDPVAAEIMNRSERALRDALGRMPDGVYTSAMTTDGFDDEDVALKATVTIAGEDIHTRRPRYP
jgi:hypothetical protein